MFGYLRFLLALLVMLSHLDIRFYGLNQGVIAVVIFYILAGYVVSYLYTNIIPKQIKDRKNNFKLFALQYSLFIKDRVKRIFPLYLFMAFLTLVFILITDFGKPHLTTLNIFSNLTIIPLNFYMWLDNSILTNPKWWLIPPAWSLGTELQAYILLPFALVFPKIKYLFILLSLSIYIVANLNIIHPDYYGYRFIVGVFFIFMLGATLQKISNSTQTKFDNYFILFILFVIFCLLSYVLYRNLEIKAYLLETSIGILFGVPIIYLLSKIKKTLPLNSFLGSLSYAIFLSHFLSIWLIKYLQIETLKSMFTIGISIIIGLIGVLFEINLLKKCRKNVD